MATHGRGLICLAMTRGRIEKLGLPLMSRNNRTRHQTAFTVSIEAREGVTTGISAPDRARTIAVAIDPTTGEEDIVTPGPCLPAGGVRRRGAGARRPYRGFGRYRPVGGAKSRRRDLRDHEGRRHHGPSPRSHPVRAVPRAQGGHHRRPDRLSPAQRQPRRARPRDPADATAWRRVPADRLCQQDHRGRAPGADQGRHFGAGPGAGPHARDQRARRRDPGRDFRARGRHRVLHPHHRRGGEGRRRADPRFGSPRVSSTRFASATRSPTIRAPPRWRSA